MSDSNKETAKNRNSIIAGGAKIVVGTILIIAGTVLRKKGLEDLGHNILAK
jgi:hypothetical protein